MFAETMRQACRRALAMLQAAADERLGAASVRLARHLAACPRCRQHAVGMGRVQLAMLLVKTKTHGADLLMRANRHAVAALSHELRALPAAERLRHASPRPALAVRISRYTQGISHAAACLAVLLLTRMGVLTGMEKFRDESVQAVQRHYARHLDPDIVKQIV